MEHIHRPDAVDDQMFRLYGVARPRTARALPDLGRHGPARRSGARNPIAAANRARRRGQEPGVSHHPPGQWRNAASRGRRSHPRQSVGARRMGRWHQISDVTERKHAEQALREGEERLRLIGDNLPDSAVFQASYDGEGMLRYSLRQLRHQASQWRQRPRRCSTTPMCCSANPVGFPALKCRRPRKKVQGPYPIST